MDKRKLSLALLMVSLLLSSLNSSNRIVRVGCVEIDNFFTTDDEGMVSGYGVDYLNEIARETGWTYEYVHGTWSDCLDWLKAGTIDLLLPAEYSKERSMDFLFSRNQCCFDYVVLMAKADNGVLFYDDWAHYPKLRIGFLEGNFLNSVFVSYAEQKGFEYTPVAFPSNPQMMEALESGEIDAIVNGNFNIESGMKTLGLISTLPAYFIARKGEESLINALDEAIDSINISHPYFTATLIEKYSISSMMVKGYTKEEHEFASTSPPIRIAGENDDYPFIWYDEKEKKSMGITPGIFALLGENSGLTFVFSQTQEHKQSWEALHKGEADVVAGVYADPWMAQQRDALFSDPYMIEYYSAIGRKDRSLPDAEHLKCAVKVTFLGIKRHIAKTHPSWELVDCPSDEECLEAVEKGKADIAFIPSLRLQTEPVLVSHPNLAISPSIHIDLPISLAVRNSPDSTLLLSTLNKAIRLAGSDQINQCISRNTKIRDSMYSFSTMVRTNTMVTALFIFTLLVVLFCIVFIIYRYHMQKIQTNMLREQNDFLAKENITKTNFLATMSHDIRTPLNIILGMEGLAEKENDIAAIRSYLTDIKHSSEFLLSLANNALDIAKIDKDQLKLDTEPTSLTVFIDQLLSLVKPLYRQKRITLDSNTLGLPTQAVSMDRLKCNQVFFNVLSNSIKYTPEGGAIAFTAETTGHDGQAVQMRFRVKDNGIGMSEQFLPHVFETFAQEQNDLNKTAMGTGLGMAIASKIIHLMGGSIKAESKIGEGTMITIDLSFPWAGETPSDHPNEKQVLLTGKTILLAEDHPLNREIAKRQLEAKGASVIQAENGKTAMEAFKKSKPYQIDAILMDIRMPEMDGNESTRAIRALPRADAKDVPILAMSANAFDEDREASLKAGMQMHLSKPLDPEVLAKAIGHCVANRKTP